MKRFDVTSKSFNTETNSASKDWFVQIIVEIHLAYLSLCYEVVGDIFPPYYGFPVALKNNFYSFCKDDVDKNHPKTVSHRECDEPATKILNSHFNSRVQVWHGNLF